MPRPNASEWTTPLARKSLPECCRGSQEGPHLGSRNRSIPGRSSAGFQGWPAAVDRRQPLDSAPFSGTTGRAMKGWSLVTTSLERLLKQSVRPFGARVQRTAATCLQGDQQPPSTRACKHIGAVRCTVVCSNVFHGNSSSERYRLAACKLSRGGLHQGTPRSVLCPSSRSRNGGEFDASGDNRDGPAGLEKLWKNLHSMFPDCRNCNLRDVAPPGLPCGTGLGLTSKRSCPFSAIRPRHKAWPTPAADI
eukprot:jgi/Botrbrau1/7434/Bobra.0083s0007.1